MPRETEIVTWKYNPAPEIILANAGGSVAHKEMQLLDDCARAWRRQINGSLQPWLDKGWRPEVPIDGTIFVTHRETRNKRGQVIPTARSTSDELILVITGASVDMVKD